MQRTKSPVKLSSQVKKKQRRSELQNSSPAQYDGTDLVISTGSTLLDLAISGGRFREGGIPAGILVEIFGPSGSGKTVLLCQIAGNVQKLGGRVMFHDPEARLNRQFSRMFGLVPEDIEYTIPDTVTEVFSSVRNWIPDKDEQDVPIYTIFADSLAALSTEMEIGEGDKMGMRRAKEFSEELRKTCRIITQRNVLMVCSNQIRQNLNAGPYGQKWKTPGGEAIGFYSSLRLRCSLVQKLKESRVVRGQKHERIIGIKTKVEIFKSSVWKPYREADLYILFDYGIDDIRANLRFLKTVLKTSVYRIGDLSLGKSIDEAIHAVETDHLEQVLKDEVIAIWNEIEEKFTDQRKPRV